MRLQIGVVGYEQRQASARTGPTVTPAQESTRYAVNAAGLAAYLILPSRKTSLGVKYFDEFSNRSTFQGYSVQIWGSVTF